jgi:antitoxin (DNA-binding transcriptional repressor) of toxin-antitoxin stability system
MKTVSVSELKANLSRYLRDVRRGSEIQVLDRGVPVARLTQPGRLGNDQTNAHRERLISAGIVRAGKGKAADVLKKPALKIRGGLSRALDEDREDRV